MMAAEDILEAIRQRADELTQRGHAKMNSLGFIAKKDETEKQREVRDSARVDFDSATILSHLTDEIERS